jgi:hypothetical protein
VSAKTVHFSNKIANRNKDITSFTRLPYGRFLLVRRKNYVQMRWTKLQLSRILAINCLLTLPTIAQMQRVLVRFDKG